MRDTPIQKTTIYLQRQLHNQVILMCHLTHCTMSEFVRIAIREKLDKLKGKNVND